MKTLKKYYQSFREYVKRDYEQTYNDFQGLGIDKVLVEIPSRFLGQLNNAKTRVNVVETYLYGTAFELGALANLFGGDNEMARTGGLVGLCFIVFGILHHNSMSRSEHSLPPISSQPSQLNQSS